MAAESPLRSSSVRVARAVAAVVLAAILVSRAAQTGNWLLAAAAIVALLGHVGLTARANTHTLMDELRAAYIRAHGTTPVRVIGLTRFDLYSPTAPGEAFVTIDTATYPGQTFAVGSTARRHRQQDYVSLANALAG